MDLRRYVLKFAMVHALERSDRLAAEAAHIEAYGDHRALVATDQASVSGLHSAVKVGLSLLWIYSSKNWCILW